MSTYHLEHELTIEAPLASVWALTLDIARWPELSPTTMTELQWLDSPIAVGSRARVKQPAQRPTVWTVTRFEPQQEFAWHAKVFGVHMVAAHHLSTTPAGTRNLLTIDMSGFGARLLGRLIGSKILHAITLENEGFKRAAETARQTAGT